MEFKSANTKRSTIDDWMDSLGELYCPPVTITRLRKLFLLALGINMGVGVYMLGKTIFDFSKRQGIFWNRTAVSQSYGASVHYFCDSRLFPGLVAFPNVYNANINCNS